MRRVHPLPADRQPLLVLALAISCALSVNAPAKAQVRPSSATVRISAGPLSSTVEKLAEESAVAILYEQRILAGLTSSGISATVTPQSGLDLLLSEHADRLTWTQVNDTTFVITENTARMPAVAAQAPAPVEDAPSRPPVSGDGSTTTFDAISVVGRGASRTTAALSAQYIESQAPGVTPQSLLADLPGVNVQMSDPYGMYELNDRMRIRGFESAQLGMTVDGVPFYNSLSEGGTIAHYILTENLATAELSAGAGDVTQPAMSALGGSIRYISKDPAQDTGGMFSATAGRFGFSRLFAKLDTGNWWDGGPAAYLAASRNYVYQWENYGVVEGQGMLEADHIETKIKQEWGYNSLTFKLSFDERSNWDTENVGLDYQSTSSGTLYPFPTDDPTLWAGFWRNGTRDYLYTVIGEFHPTDTLSFKVTPYYNDHQYWLWYGIGAESAMAAYQNAIAGTPGRTDIVAANGYTAQRISRRDGTRTGLTSSVAWEAGAHTLEAGLWYEDNDYSYFHPIQNSDPVTGEILVNEVTSVNGDFDVKTKVTQVFVKDTISLLDDRFIIQLGAKGLSVDRNFFGYATAADFNTSTPRDLGTKYSDWFQPQAGLTWKFNDNLEGFVNYAENFSAVTVSALTSVIYNPNIQPERSENIDLGLRFEGDTWSGFISAYNTRYQDRIISLTTADRLSAVQGSTYLNVNGVDTYGLELSGDWTPLPEWRFTSALSFSRSTYDGDYYAFDSDGEQNVLVEVDGNDLPDQPNLQGNMTAYYNKGHIRAHFGVQYLGDRYGDTMNTITVPSYTVYNGGIAYSGQAGEKLEGVTFRLNIYNLFDKTYISSISPRQDGASFKLGYPRAVYGSVEYAF